MRSVYPGERFTLEKNGRSYLVKIEYDNTRGAPWEDDAGCVNVSRVSNEYGTEYGTGKKPGEYVFHRGDLREWSYMVDMPECLERARKESWGISEESRAAFVKEKGREPTKREIAMIAVNQNIEWLRAWCSDEWCFVGVVVIHLDDEGEETNNESSLLGVESCGNYARDSVVPELIADIERQIESAQYPVSCMGV